MPHRHQGKEEGLREALGLYEKLQRIAETVHGLRNSHIAMAHRAIADVHMMLNEHGAPSCDPCMLALATMISRACRRSSML